MAEPAQVPKTEPDPPSSKAEKESIFETPPSSFGEGDFWSKYYQLAVKDDEEAAGNLGSEFDILLIFAGLFSGVNSAFIGFTLPMLSAPANDEVTALLRFIALKNDSSTTIPSDLPTSSFSPSWDAVRINLLFASSLGCSLLAAFGALLGKRWLSIGTKPAPSYMVHGARLPTTVRYGDVLGVRRWHLHFVMQVFPVLLEVGLLIFWIALIDFFWSLHHVIAWVAMVILVAGFIFRVITLMASISDRNYPIRHILERELIPYIKGLGLSALHLMASGVHYASVTVAALLELTARCTVYLLVPFVFAIDSIKRCVGQTNITRHSEHSEEVLWPFLNWVDDVGWNIKYGTESYVDTVQKWKDDKEGSEQNGGAVVRWMFAQSDDDAALQAAHNILAITGSTSVYQLSYPHSSYTQIWLHFRAALAAISRSLDDLPDLQSEKRAASVKQHGWEAVVYGRALCHLALVPGVPIEGLIAWSKKDPIVADCVDRLGRLPLDDCPELQMFRTIWAGIGVPDTKPLTTGLPPPLIPLYTFSIITLLYGGTLKPFQRQVDSPPSMDPTTANADLERQDVPGEAISSDPPKLRRRTRSLFHWDPTPFQLNAESGWLRMMMAERVVLETLQSNETKLSLLPMTAEVLYQLGLNDSPRAFFRNQERLWYAYTSTSKDNEQSSAESIGSTFWRALKSYPDHAELAYGRQELSVTFRCAYSTLMRDVRSAHARNDPIGREVRDSLVTWWPYICEELEAIITQYDKSKPWPLYDSVTNAENAVMKEIIQTLHLLAPNTTNDANIPHPAPLWMVCSALDVTNEADSAAIRAFLELVAKCTASLEEQLELFEDHPGVDAFIFQITAGPDTSLQSLALDALVAQSAVWLGPEIGPRFRDAGLQVLNELVVQVLSEIPADVAQWTASVRRILRLLTSLDGGREKAIDVVLVARDSAAGQPRILIDGAILSLWYETQDVKDNQKDYLDSLTDHAILRCGGRSPEDPGLVPSTDDKELEDAFKEVQKQVSEQSKGWTFLKELSPSLSPQVYVQGEQQKSAEPERVDLDSGPS